MQVQQRGMKGIDPFVGILALGLDACFTQLEELTVLTGAPLTIIAGLLFGVAAIYLQWKAGDTAVGALIKGAFVGGLVAAPFPFPDVFVAYLAAIGYSYIRQVHGQEEAAWQNQLTSWQADLQAWEADLGEREEQLQRQLDQFAAPETRRLSPPERFR